MAKNTASSPAVQRAREGNKPTDSQNSQARFIVERLRKVLPIISGGARTLAARAAVGDLERALSSYDAITRAGENW